jgi:hypothetical protein
MKNKYYCIFVALVCWIHSNFSTLQAQELNTLTVNAPSGISGDYRIARALFVDLALEKVSENVEVSMFDIEGRLVSTRTFNNIKEDRLRVDISTLNNGVYNVRIVTSEGTATRKVIVQN